MNYLDRPKASGSCSGLAPRRNRISMRLPWACVMLPFLLLASGAVSAQEIVRKMTAEFRPDVLNPGHAVFRNTTRHHWYCSPSRCMPSIRLGIDVDFPEGLQAGATGRDALYQSLPTQSREVRVIHQDGLSDATVRWRVDTFTQSVGTARDGFVGSHTAPAPCTVRHGNTGGWWFDFQWNIPEGSACIKLPNRDISRFQITNFGVSYIMDTPDPLAMRNGIYTGQLVLSVGPNGDIDFGDHGVPAESTLILEFELTVAHELTISIPPGSDRAILAPDGGWSQWTDRGRKPSRLSKEVPFTISSSSPFDVKLVCQHPQADGRCGLVDQASGDAVSMTTLLSIPGLRDMASGEPVVRYPLSWHDTSVRMRSESFLIQRPSRVHFEVDGADLDAILDKPGSHWKGDVTVVFDAQL